MPTPNFKKLSAQKRMIEIRRELKALIKKKLADLVIAHGSVTGLSIKKQNHAVNEARMEINQKYGKDWRGNTQNLSMGNPSIYDGHVNGEHWMD